MAEMRTFETGATRNVDSSKYDYEGFLSPLVLEEFAKYMHKHRFQRDGNVRDSDNWQKGIPLSAYMKSGWRHFMGWWKTHRGIPFTPAGPGEPESLIEDLMALLFNVQGYAHELLKVRAEPNPKVED